VERSIGFGLMITLYGMVSVFAILLLVILASELLKRAFQEEVPPMEERVSPRVGFTEEELVAVSAVLQSYFGVSPLSSEMGSRLIQSTPRAWRRAGWMEQVRVDGEG
jgi:Na+-transporting methylmalonyl-CoA/oxaloacetate decarboxylase gamma subunit